MSRRDLGLLLEDILEACHNILSYTSGMDYESFSGDKKTIDAVVRNFEIIGEASTMVPEDFRSEHPQIEWRRITGFRNRIIHEYFGIDYENVWKIRNENVPELMAEIELLIKEL
jgi:uncharacterized protein with HEPN domain